MLAKAKLYPGCEIASIGKRKDDSQKLLCETTSSPQEAKSLTAETNPVQQMPVGPMWIEKEPFERSVEENSAFHVVEGTSFSLPDTELKQAMSRSGDRGKDLFEHSTQLDYGYDKLRKPAESLQTGKFADRDQAKKIIRETRHQVELECIGLAFTSARPQRYGLSTATIDRLLLLSLRYPWYKKRNVVNHVRTKHPEIGITTLKAYQALTPSNQSKATKERSEYLEKIVHCKESQGLVGVNDRKFRLRAALDYQILLYMNSDDLELANNAARNMMEEAPYRNVMNNVKLNEVCFRSRALQLEYYKVTLSLLESIMDAGTADQQYGKAGLIEDLDSDLDDQEQCERSTNNRQQSKLGRSRNRTSTFRMGEGQSVGPSMPHRPSWEVPRSSEQQWRNSYQSSKSLDSATEPRPEGKKDKRKAGTPCTDLRV